VEPDFALALPVRWAGLLALAALVGGLAVAVTVLPPGLTTLRRRLTAWSRASVGLLLVTSAAELLVRARTMAGGDLGSALRAAPVVLSRTHLGLVWTVRAGTLVALLALIGRSGRAAQVVASAAALGVALTTSLVGHAADHGDLSLPALIDWLHVAAATTWTGGLFCLTALVLPEASQWPREQLAALLRRFSTLAGLSLGVVVASGIFNACVQVGSLHALASTAYGRILVAKVALVTAMACLGAANRFAVLSGLGRPTVARPAAARLARYVAWEVALAVVVFGCTAVLTESVPPRHGGHAQVDG
jgi:copper resistance protein D